MSYYMANTYPREVEQAKAERWPVLLPVGTMEYHSDHCPYGCDALVAQGMAREIAKKIDCLVLPTVFYGCSSYAVGGPEHNTIDMDVDVFEQYIYNILASLFKSGFDRCVYILIFHQTEDYLPTALACMKAAKKLIFRYLEQTQGVGWWGKNENKEFYSHLAEKDNPWNRITVVNGKPKGMDLGSDHAGIYECSTLERLYPGSIKLERLREDGDWFAQSSKDMSDELGKKLVDTTVDELVRLMRSRQ